jgi:hypothetical protein
MVRERRSRAWSRLAAVLAFALALVAVPAGASGGLDAASRDRGLAQSAPVVAHASASVARSAAAGAATGKHLATDWAISAPAALIALLLGWTLVRRNRRPALATAAPRAAAARAPPSTVGP